MTQGIVTAMTTSKERRPRARSMTTQCSDRRSVQSSRCDSNQALTASPPMVDGKTWLKNMPTSVYCQLIGMLIPVPMKPHSKRSRKAAITLWTVSAATQNNPVK